MYVSLLSLYVQVSQQSPLLYIGLISLLMASWGLIVSVITQVAIQLFDHPDEHTGQERAVGRFPSDRR